MLIIKRKKMFMLFLLLYSYSAWKHFLLFFHLIKREGIDLKKLAHFNFDKSIIHYSSLCVPQTNIHTYIYQDYQYFDTYIKR